MRGEITMKANLEIVKLLNDVVTASGCKDPDTPKDFGGDGSNDCPTAVIN